MEDKSAQIEDLLAENKFQTALELANKSANESIDLEQKHKFLYLKAMA